MVQTHTEGKYLDSWYIQGHIVLTWPLGIDMEVYCQ